MTTFSARRGSERCPVHPGFLLTDTVIPATGRSKSEIARLLGISMRRLDDILNETRPVTLDVAARLGKLFGNGPRVWIGMQMAHDAWHAERQVDVSKIPTL